jgi:ABC-type polysaccharide/polyol phosphate export permease
MAPGELLTDEQCGMATAPEAIETSPFPETLPVYDTASAPPAWRTELAGLWQYRDLIVQLVVRDIRVRYKRSVLGVGWTVLNPLLMMVVLTLAFSQLFHVDSPNYPVFLLSATLAWAFFAQSSTIAVHQLLSSGPLIQRIYVPRTVFAVSATLVGLVNLLMSLVPLLLLMLVTHAPIGLALAWLPASIVILAAFTLGISLILSMLAIRFHDVVDLYQVILTAWFFLTPIIYPASIVPGEQAWRLMLNPMVPLLTLFRDPIYEGRSPDGLTVLLSVSVAAVTLTIGWLLFTARSDELAYRL